MARQSRFKKGGGFLDGVDSTITNYEFTDAFGDTPYKPGKMKDSKTGKMVDKPHSLNCLMSVRVDGADEDTTTTLKVATVFDEWEITDDGHTITPVDGAKLSGNTAFGRFMQSWEKVSGQGAESETVDEASFNFEPIIGSRIRTIQEPYTAQELLNLKKLGATEKQKGKDGREYERRHLVVEQVYESDVQPKAAVAGHPTTSVKKSTTTTSPSKRAVATKPAGKANGKAVEVEEEDVKDLSGRALVEMLEAAGGKLAKAKLSVKTLMTPALKGHAQRDDVRKWLFSDDNLEELASDSDGLIAFDKAKQMIELVTE